MEGKTERETRIFFQKVEIREKLKENPKLRELRKTPEKLVAKLQELS